VDDDVVLGDHRLGLEAHHLLAQVDERLQAIDERHEDRHAGIERALVAAEALDDAGAGLGNDAHRARRDEQHEHGDDDDHDQPGFHDSSYSLTSAVAPRISMTWTRLPASMTSSSS
jgi:hypothetical protein